MGIVRNVPAAWGISQDFAVTSTNLQMSWGLCNLGDRVLAVVSSIAPDPTFATPAGWNSLGTYKTTTTITTAVYYRDYVIEDPTPVTYTWSQGAASGRMTVAYVPFGGCDLNQPPIISRNATLASSRTATPPALVMADGDWFVGVTAGRQTPGDAATITWTRNGAPNGNSWYQLYSAATGTTSQLTTFIYDTGPTGAVSTQPSATADKNLAEVNNWAIRLRAPLGQDGWRVGMPIR